MTMTAAEKQNIETQALLKRADMVIKNTGKMPKGLVRQLANDEGFTSGIEKALDQMEEVMGVDEMNRIMNLSDEDRKKEEEELNKKLMELGEEPLI